MFKSAKSRPAFTLVEMLVVITIIGMLMALLLPAINSARESARQVLCTNNQKQLATAVIVYDSSKQRVPGLMSLAPSLEIPMPPVDAGGNFTQAHRNRVWGWVPPLLPYLEQEELYNQMLEEIGDTSSTKYEELFRSIYFSSFDCPTNTRANLDQPWISYYVNGGRANAAVGGLDNAPGGYAPELFGYATTGFTTSPLAPPDYRQNGVFTMRFHVKQPGFPPIIHKRPNSIVDIKDSKAVTVLLAENCNPRYLVDGGLIGNTWSNTYVNSAGNVVAIEAPQEHDNAILWHMPGEHLESGTRVGINQHRDEPLDPAHARPSSYHPGIVIMAFADGSVRKVSAALEYNVYSMLMSSCGRDVRNPATGANEPQKGPQWPNGGAVSEADLQP